MLTCVLDNIVHIPDRSLLLLSVDFLLVESPIRELSREGPHGHLRRNVDQLEQTRLSLPRCSRMTVGYAQVEERVVVARMVVFGPSRELLVCGHGR